LSSPVAVTGRRVNRRDVTIALLFLLPAALLLLVWIVYPVVYTIWRSFYDAAGSKFVGLAKYHLVANNSSTRTALKNNAVWLVVAPTLATAIGLVLAVLTERIKLGSAFKVVIFMPMAISFLSAGVIFRLVYDKDPHKGLANAAVNSVRSVFEPPGAYPGARPSRPELFAPFAGGYQSTETFTPGQSVPAALVAIPPGGVPKPALLARPPAVAASDAISGTVWLDFAPGGGGTKGVVDERERGLPGAHVEAVASNGKLVGRDTSGPTGRFTIRGLSPGSYRIRLAAATFRPPWGGISWLGPSLVTPAVIGAYLWIWAGFAMVVIAAGLAAIPRETLEAARVDGASEWQVFSRVTVPLLWPVLLVVAVTLMINVLKVFDLVLVIPPGSVQANANVIALELWRVSFGGGHDQGLGSALAVVLFLLVIPAMIFNIRRFRSE
jgi:alpha-glucoside transport system permease protein